MNTPFDINQINAAIDIFMRDGDVHELRALKVEKGGTTSGYFDNKDALAQAAANLSGRCAGVYITANPVKKELLARSVNRVKSFAHVTTKDDEIFERRIIAIDIDPCRPKGISSTNRERNKALTVANEIQKWLANHDVEPQVLASSGNGIHLIYRVNWQNDVATSSVYSEFLKIVAMRFGNDECDIDASIFNPSRVLRLYGTMACKGDSTPERPHRIAKIVSNLSGNYISAQHIHLISEIMLEEIPEAVRTNKSTIVIPGPIMPGKPKTRYDLREYDVVGAFKAAGLYIGNTSSPNMYAVKCPNEDSHSGDGGKTDTAIWVNDDGRMPGFHCYHSHCTTIKIQEAAHFLGNAEEFGAKVRPLSEFDLTDQGNSDRIVSAFGDYVGYIPEYKALAVYTKYGRWVINPKGSVVLDMHLDALRSFREECFKIGDGEYRKKALKFCTNSENWPSMRNLLARMQARSDIEISVGHFDVSAWHINTPNGYVDIRDGSVQENNPNHRCMKQTNVKYDSTATCHKFDQFLLSVFCGDVELVEYFWRVIGYSVTGSVREQVFFVMVGNGSNGKSTLVEILSRVLGDYSAPAPSTLLIENKGDRHPTEIASVQGRRMVYTSETGEGRRLAEELVKSLTGGEQLSARRMYGDFFSFIPTHKLWLGTNYKPIVRGTDDGIWRRIHLIPFNAKFQTPEVAKPGDPLCDKKLVDEMDTELEGILAKAIRSAGEWYRDGLCPPPQVLEEVRAYREDQDTLGTFIAECVEDVDDGCISSSVLYSKYVEWAKSNGESILSNRMFSIHFEKRGYRKRKSSGSFWVGVKYVPQGEKAIVSELNLKEIE